MSGLEAQLVGHGVEETTIQRDQILTEIASVEPSTGFCDLERHRSGDITLAVQQRQHIVSNMHMINKP